MYILTFWTLKKPQKKFNQQKTIWTFKVIKKERGLKRKRKEQNETKRETKWIEMYRNAHHPTSFRCNVCSMVIRLRVSYGKGTGKHGRRVSRCPVGVNLGCFVVELLPLFQESCSNDLWLTASNWELLFTANTMF